MTREGFDLLSKAKPLIAEIENLKFFGKLLEIRTFSIGVADSIAASWGPSVLRQALTLVPNLKLEVHVHRYEDSDGLVSLLRSENGKGRVLVVGHWSTIPEILKALGYAGDGKIERSAYDNLFVVIPRGEQAPFVLHLHY